MICIVLIKIIGRNNIILKNYWWCLIMPYIFLHTKEYIFESLVFLDFSFHSLSAFWGEDNLSRYSRTCCFLINESQRCSGHWHCHTGCGCRWRSDETNCRIYSACQRCPRYCVADKYKEGSCFFSLSLRVCYTELQFWGYLHVIHLLFLSSPGVFYLLYR